MKIYSIKVALRGISPMIWRRLRVSGHTSLAALHQIIQVINGWDDDHLHQFHIYGKDYGISYEGGIAFSDNVHKIYLDDFAFDIGDKFTYEYNFHENWLHDIRIENIEESPLSTNYVYCVKGIGMPGTSKDDEMDITIKLLKAIVKANESTTVGDIQDLIEELDTVKFNCKKINRCLKKIEVE